MKIKLAASLLLFLLSSCTIETEEKTGPDGSWWLGGDDGGVFVNILEDGNPEDDRYQRYTGMLKRDTKNYKYTD